ncbi:peptidase S8/S53 domain-containing protein [Mycena polygramma]|nr:peptidase S8/S53 domain-containing protein [Mycena polygramma]
MQMYIVDSGAAPHSEFGDRLVDPGPNYGDAKFGPPTKPVYAHGTSVASVAARQTLGVANEVDIIPIRISISEQIATTKEMVDGMAHALNHYVIERGRRGGAIINLSSILLKRQDSQIFIAAAHAAGMHVVTGAGNDNEDACDTHQAIEPIVVGIDINDRKGSFSNFGQARTGSLHVSPPKAEGNLSQCVDVWAPGEDIVVADSANSDGYLIKTGTSLAAPFVSGMIALIIATQGDMPPDDMKQKLISLAKIPFKKPLTELLSSRIYPTSGIVTVDPSLTAFRPPVGTDRQRLCRRGSAHIKVGRLCRPVSTSGDTRKPASLVYHRADAVLTQKPRHKRLRLSLFVIAGCLLDAGISGGALPLVSVPSLPSPCGFGFCPPLLSTHSHICRHISFNPAVQN